MSDGTEQAGRAEVTALQAALAAEHAAVYGYGVVGGRIGDARRTEARSAYDAHRARRDALVRAVRDLGGTPVAASAAYALPFPVQDGPAAVRLAARMEERVAGALREAAVRAVRWSGESVAFPGLAERSGERTGAAGTTPSASAPAKR